MFRDEILPSSEVQGALGELRKELSEWYELVSEGADYLSLEQWLRAIDGKQLLTDVVVKGHAVRLTEPQAREEYGDENITVYTSRFKPMQYAPPRTSLLPSSSFSPPNPLLTASLPSYLPCLSLHGQKHMVCE